MNARRGMPLSKKTMLNLALGAALSTLIRRVFARGPHQIDVCPVPQASTIGAYILTSNSD